MSKPLWNITWNEYMGALRVLSSEIIKAPNSTDQEIDLTPWDLQFLLIAPTKIGLFYDHSLAANQIDRLRHSLSSTLAFFPPLEGRLKITENKDNTVSCSVTCNNAGVLFVHAAIENTCVVDILGPTYLPLIVHSFFPFNGARNYEGISKPLLAVQVTELVDGVFIGFRFNHVVTDGKSMWHFINSWAEISRGCCNQISKLPSLERWFPNGIQRPVRFHFIVEPQNNHTNVLNCLLSQNHMLNHSNDEELNPSTRLFHFTKEKIVKLKYKANIEIRTNKISSLQALLTHVWCSVIKSKKLDPQEEVYNMFPIGVRPRLDPPLPQDYFGNAVVDCWVSMKVGELLEEDGLGKGAWEMNKMISLQSDEKLKNKYDRSLRNPSIRISGTIDSNTLASNSSPWFDIYGNDFGWGKPVAFRSVNKINGMVSVFAGKEEGSIDLQVCLPYNTLEAMSNDPNFMDAVSN